MKEFKSDFFSLLDEVAEIKALIKFQSLSNETILRETADNGYSLTSEEISGYGILNTMISNRLSLFDENLRELYQSIKE